MPPKTKSSSTTSGGSAKRKSASTSGTATPVLAQTENPDALKQNLPVPASTTRPNKEAYNAEQDKMKTEIDLLQAKLSSLRDKISHTPKPGLGNDRRSVLRTELDSIRERQTNSKAARGKIIDRVKATQDGIQKKIKDLQAAKSKVPFKTVADVDAHIKKLESQVESGNMKLADEKKALHEISQCKRNRRLVESFQADQDAIEADRRAIDDLRKQLDDPESKVVSERYNVIKTELEELKKVGDEAFAGRSKLFEERDKLQSQINALYAEKRESVQRFRDANDRYWNKVNEERAKRAERARAQRAAEEAQKKREIAERLREEAAVPVFQQQIEDCQTLVDYFSGKNSGQLSFKGASPSSIKTDVAGLPKLELRKVEEVHQEGLLVSKKKGAEEENYVVGSKGKGKGKKGNAKTNGSSDTSAIASTTTQLNIPLPTLSALLALSISPPASTTDVARVVDDLRAKKAWFEANQGRVTAENITKAEADIKRLTDPTKETRAEKVPPPDISVPNKGEQPTEQLSTPRIDDPSTAVSSGGTVDKVDIVQEEGLPSTTVSSGGVVDKVQITQETEGVTTRVDDQPPPVVIHKVEIVQQAVDAAGGPPSTMAYSEVVRKVEIAREVKGIAVEES